MSYRLLSFVLISALVPPAARGDEPPAVTIEQVQWGFDGKAQERTFTPLSVLVQNNTPLEFEGTLTLTKLVQSTKPIDAAVEREVYVGPLSSRWVQFVPYVISDWEQWRLSWGHAEDQQYDLPTPAMGERATVLLYDPDRLQSAGGVLRRFDLNLFPPLVTATDGLRGVVLDHAPRWQGARRQAFLEWLRAGGKLFLLQDDQGRFPVFGESLSVLNAGGDRFSIGRGEVQRLAATVAELTPETVRSQILSDRLRGAADARYELYRRSLQYQATAPLLNRSGWDRDTQMFLDLQTIARFARRWWVIYLLSLAYLLVGFPICLRIGREARDYRWTYLAILINVGLFSYGFASLGRLGAAEVNRARSVAVAHQLHEGVYDVTQWTCVGVRAGGEYTVEHPGTARLYTTSQDVERVDGRIVAGPDARLEVAIPPASTQTILSRRRAEAIPLGLNVEASAFDDRGLASLSIRTGPEFPAAPAMMLVAHTHHIYQLRSIGDRLTLVPSSRRPLSSFLVEEMQVQRVIGLGAGLLRARDPDKPNPDSLVFETALRTLIGNSFGLGDRIDLALLQMPDDLLRVFIYVPQPPALQITSDSFPDQQGYVLYCVDLPARGGRPAGAGSATSPVDEER